MLNFATKKIIVPTYIVEDDNKKAQVLKELQDLSSFISLSLELIDSKKLVSAKEGLMKAAIKIESITTMINGGTA